jgi:hypothetical protein
MIEVRLRTRIPRDELDEKKGKLLTDADYNLLLAGAAKVRKPDGSLLCVYRPACLAGEMADAYPELTRIRGLTDNRGAAAALPRRQRAGKTVTGNAGRSFRTRSKPIMSSIIGAFDPQGPQQYCRLTAYNAKQADRFETLHPLFRRISEVFEAEVPERYKAQQAYAQATNPDWLVRGTPFTTITINNTYPTGVHTDKGDLDEGFSCLATARRGDYTGGLLVFPRYRVAIDLQDGDLVLMDAHEYHGNTPIRCGGCGDNLDRPDHRCEELGPTPSPERISVVAYFRTGMRACGTLAEEDAKRAATRERHNAQRLGLDAETP